MKTILVVDDEDYLVIFLEKLLVAEGYRVVKASNGKQAVEIYKANQSDIDMILMDITMPVLDGLEAYKELITFDPDALILLMSAFSKEHFDGVVTPHFIRKPMLPSELFSAIRVTLGLS